MPRLRLAPLDLTSPDHASRCHKRAERLGKDDRLSTIWQRHRLVGPTTQHHQHAGIRRHSLALPFPGFWPVTSIRSMIYHI